MAVKNQKNKESQWFGFKKVRPAEKMRLVAGVFDSVAGRYDLMNDLMSGGIHRIWKRAFVKAMKPKPGKTLLDVAGGTGDIAFRYRKAVGDDTQITVCDFNAEMLNVGQARAIDRGYVHGLSWVEGDAADLPFDDMSFHTYSISFGLRNVTRIDDALAEAFRVLKPGGQFFCLEFSHVEDPALRKLYDTYSFKVIPKIGALVAQDSESYQYLAESIRQFPKPDALKRRIVTAGFAQPKVQLLSGGIAAIHSAVKL